MLFMHFGGGGGGSSEMTIHYDQEIMYAWAQLRNWGMRGVDVNDVGPYIPDYIQMAPFVQFSDPTSFANDYALIWYDYFIPMLGVMDTDRTGVTFGNININNFQTKFINSPAIITAVATQNVYLDDDLNQNVFPKLRTTLRDIGSVMSSSFLDTQAIVLMNKSKVLSKYQSDLNIKELEISQNAWVHYLEWKWKVMDFQVKYMESYYKTGMPYNDSVNKVTNENLMFPFSVLEQVRAIVSCLGQPQATSKSTSFNPSPMQTAATYVGMAGALTGMYNGLTGGETMATMSGGGGAAMIGAEAGWGGAAEMGMASGMGAMLEGVTVEEVASVAAVALLA